MILRLAIVTRITIAIIEQSSHSFAFCAVIIGCIKSVKKESTNLILSLCFSIRSYLLDEDCAD